MRGRTGHLPEFHRKDNYVIATSNSSFRKTGHRPVVIALAESSDNWKLAAFLRGDRESYFSSESYFGSSSLEGSVSGFWALLWDSLNISWVPKMHHHFVDWPYRAVNQVVHLLRRNGKGPARPYVNIEGYTKHVAIVLIKNTLKRWLDDNP